MQNFTGSNLTGVKTQNRNLILKLISTQPDVSRADLARMTGLTKTTLGNIVAELMEGRVICEQSQQSREKGEGPGRKPIFLDIGPQSPCIAGLLIKRGVNTAVLGDLKGRIIQRFDEPYQGPISAETLIDSLVALYRKVRGCTGRRLLGVGVASIGPVDIRGQRIVNPPNFFGIKDLPVGRLLEERIGLPAFLINDSDAGALAEKMYGSAKNLDNFIYLHIMNGIGAGYILGGNLYSGAEGKSGEIGHISINFAGPRCDCGNTGCLELYANLQQMNRRIADLKKVFQKPTVLPQPRDWYDWIEIIDAAGKKDYFAAAALEEFCEYLSHALTTAVNLLDVGSVIVGYEASSRANNLLEEILQSKLNGRALNAHNQITVQKSVFHSDAPLIGSVAVVANKIFTGEAGLC